MMHPKDHPPAARSCFRALASLTTVLAAMPGFSQVTTTGYDNVQRSWAPGTLLSHPLDADNDSANIGRTTTVNYIRGWVVVGPEGPGSRSGSDQVVRVYDISNPTAPIRRRPADFGHTFTSWRSGDYGWNTHGSAQTHDSLYYPVLTVSSFGGTVGRGNDASRYPISYGRAGMAGPWHASFQWYGDPDAQFTIGKRYKLNGQNIYSSVDHYSWNHVQQFGGGNWHPIFFGDLLIYVRSDAESAGAASGRDNVVVYRINYSNFEDTNLSARVMQPVVVGTLSTGFSAYWPNLFSDGAKLYVVGSSASRVQVADITQAAEINGNGSVSLVADYVTSLKNATYPVYQDTYAFIHNKKFDMGRLIAGAANPVVLALDQDTRQAVGETTVHPKGVNTSQMSLPLGNLWLTGGYEENNQSQGMGVWLQQQAPDTTKPTVAYHIPEKFRGNYPRFAPLSFIIHEVPRDGAVRPGVDFTVRPLVNGVLGAHVPGFGLHDMSGIYTYTPDAPLAANTTYQVDFLSNPSQNIGFRDAAGNYIDAYSFTFSTGGLTAPTPPTINSVSTSSYQPAPGANVTVTVNAGGTGNQYRFNTNGTWSDWSSSSNITTSFPVAGRYRVLVQVKNTAGVTSSSYVNILVMDTPALANAPTQSNSMAVGQDPNGRRVWVVNPDSETVSVLNAATGAKISGGEYHVGKNPRSIARDRHGRYWVTVMGEDKIVVLNPDGTTFQTIGGGNDTIPYGAAPFAVCPNHDGSLMFVTYYGKGRLARFTVPEGGTTAISAPVVSTSSTPTARAIAVRYDPSATTTTRVFVTRFISTNIQAELHEYNGTHASLARTRVINAPFVDTPDAGNNGAGIPNYLAGIAISRDGNHAIVSAKKDNIFRGRLFSNTTAGENDGVGDLTQENTVRAVLMVFNLTNNTELSSARRDFDNSDGPVGVTFSSRGDTAFIALQGNNEVVGIDGLNLANAGGSALLTAKLGTDLAPQGVLYDESAKRLYVQNFMGRTVSVFNATDFHDFNQNAFPPLATTNTVAAELLNPLALEGKRIFYNAADTRMSAEGYISCASCHVDGGHDGRVWDFTQRGEGLRRTTDLRGRGGLRHGNVHWSANFDEIQDFEHDIRDAFGGTGFIPLDAAQFAAAHPGPGSVKSTFSGEGYDELNALAAYVSSLGVATVPRSPERANNGALTTAAATGKQLFDGLVAPAGKPALACATCHSGYSFTDSIVAPVNGVLLDNVGTLVTGETSSSNSPSGRRLGGTLTGIDVPSLLGLHASRVYLHHGLAETLDDVFSFAGGKLYEAENATKLYTYSAPTVRRGGYTPTGEPTGGGGDNRDFYGAKMITLTLDREDLDGDGALDAGEDTNGNNLLDSNSNHTAIRFTGVDGGSGGAARLHIRYRTTSASVSVKVNGGTATTYALPASNPWYSARWHSIDISLNAGTGNTIELRRVGNDVPIDAIRVSNASDTAAAAAHRQVLDISSTERANLLAYLRQIDGRDENGVLRDPDLVLHYKFDEGAGTTVGDSAVSGNNHTTTVSTATWTSSGRFGAAYGSSTSFPSFFPANQGDLDFDPRGDAYSISVWVKMTSNSGYKTIFSKGGTTAASRQYQLWTGATSASIAGYSGGAVSGGFAISPALDDGNWHLLTFVNVNDNGTWKTRIYYDNNTTPFTFNTGSSGKVAHLLRIGEVGTGYNRMLGFIDDLRVYKRALTQAEIAQLYAGEDPSVP